MEAELAVTRRCGFAIDNEEWNIGLRRIAAPIFNQFGEAIAGVSVSGPLIRLPPRKADEFGMLVCKAAGEMTSHIGGQSPFGQPN